MSRRADPARLGLFVVSGLALVAAAALVLGAGRLFERKETYILYFDASVRGLSAGAPVKYRGVTIGKVKDVKAFFNQADEDRHMPVLVEVSERALREKTDLSFNIMDPSRFDALVARGLRGTLEAESLLTGLLYVELEFRPDTPPPVYHQLQKIHTEIPTAPTRIQRLLENLADLDVKGLFGRIEGLLGKLDEVIGEVRMKEISADLRRVLDSVDGLARSPGLAEAIAALPKAIDEIRKVSAQIDARTARLSEGATGTLEEGRRTLEEGRRALEESRRTMEEARLTLAEARKGLQDLRDAMDPRAPLRRDLAEGAEKPTDAAQAAEDLVGLLSRNPNVLISGKKQKESKP